LRRHQPFALAAFEASIVIPALATLTLLVLSDPSNLTSELLLWVVVLAGVELLPVPFWRGLQISMSFPILLAAGFLHQPAIAALIALVGSFDPREFRREINLLRALFNRSQAAIAVLVSSATFHSLSSVGKPWKIVLPVAVVAAVAHYLINVALVSCAVSIAYGVRYSEALRRIRIGRSFEFAINYIGLGLVGTALAKLYIDPYIGAWALPAMLTPLVFARQMFFRSRALEEAHGELKTREKVLQALSDRMAEERQDERAQIAAYLHDDLAQLLFRMSLQVDLAKRHLKGGDTDAAEKDLEAIRETKNRTSELVRALIRDLHRSPLGRAGLAEALTSFTGDIAKGAGIRFHTDVARIPLPPAIQLIAYHIAREAAMNSLKHSGADNVWISLRSNDDGAELTIRDDGVGFDPDADSPEGHFGLAMMRERAQVFGGAFSVSSAHGEGTTISVQFPTAWIQGDASSSQGPSSDDGILPVAEPAPAREPKASNREVVPA
jgi:signal transduction histidine kinase